MNIQALLNRKNDQPVEIVLSVSNVAINGKKGYIFVVKEVSRSIKRERSQEKLAEELQNSLLMMNLPLHQFIKRFYTADMNTTILEAGRIMARKKQDALIIMKDSSTPIGIITDQDFKNRVVSENLDTSEPASTVMSSPITILSEKALLYEAMFAMDQKKIKHLVVKNEKGKITGIVNKNDLLEVQHNSTSYLLKEIERAELVADIQAVYDRLAGIIQLLLSSGTNSRSITGITSSISDAITKRLIELAIESTGKPPANFAFIAMGSEGRQEQTLKTDQDNAIIFEDQNDQNTEQNQKYFLELAQKVNEWLDAIGYEYCVGEIMASNKRWCQPLAQWKTYFSTWIDNSDPESVLDTTIFFDFRIVYGDDKLVHQLREHVHEVVENKAVFFHHMMQSIQKFKPPVNLLGNIVTSSRENNAETLDIKKIMVPITGFARIYAVKNKLAETNTTRRLEKLQEHDIIKPKTINEALQAYDFLMVLRFKTQSNKMLQHNTIDNYIDINKLTEIELSTLKKTFSEISGLLTQLNFDFKGVM
jgi:signal-transduction protein with cAMP-binding, CBS, and nucleotidyltransferase domain